jgi:hypothetical protein
MPPLITEYISVQTNVGLNLISERRFAILGQNLASKIS